MAPMNTARLRWGARIRALVRVAFGGLLAVLVAEAAVRRFYYLKGGYDNVMGPQIAPGMVRYGLEGMGTSYWVERGLRRASAPDPALPSILALGDSFTESLGLDDDDVFTHRLERKLRERGSSVQVLNAGHAGASVADYVALAPRYREWFSPRWTVVQLRAADLTTEPWQSRPSYARFTRGTGNEIVTQPAVVAQHSRLWFSLLRIRQESMLLTLGFIRLNDFLAAARAEPPLFRGGAPTQPPPESYETDPSAWPVAEELALLARAYDGRMTIAYLPEFDPEAPSKTGPVERVLQEACDAQRISCLNLRRHFQKFAADRVSPFGFPNSAYNFGHMNELGHHALADDLEREIARLQSDGIF